MSEHQEQTQAQRWLYALQIRGAHIAGAEQAAEAARVVNQVDADYPNQLFNLDSAGQVIGLRRVFGDRSYIDFMTADHIQKKIQIGTLTEGMLGTAGNGRLIT